MVELREYAQEARTWISGKLLDIAECLPKTARGPIATLQTIREFQRERTTDSLGGHEPPPESAIELGSFRLVEAYAIEDFTKLTTALQKLIPSDSRLATDRNRVAELGRTIRSMSAGSWWNIGLIVRQRRAYSPMFDIREIPELPEAVELIRVAVRHALPSLMSILVAVFILAAVFWRDEP